jgi:hypothetical protein
MSATLTAIDALLTRIERLAEDLSSDPGRHVLRSATELRTTFAARGAVEPAVGRVRDSVLMLRGANRDGSRRDFQRRAHGVDYLQQIVESELLPSLRRLGFEV